MSREFRLGVALLAALNVLIFAQAALGLPGRSQVAEICESAAKVASDQSGVPLDVLRAISLTETGRKSDGAFQPWPWTVNMEGVGKWFDTLAEARAYVDRHFARGARSFDVGCFQINYRWHGKAFDSIDDMFDPVTNAKYAARFLQELYQETGDWSAAAGAYHSRTPKFAKKYKARFNRIRANLSEPMAVAYAQPTLQADTVQQPVSAPRVNNYPLLRHGPATGYASLVPLGNRRTRMIDVSGARSLLEQR